MQVAAGAAATGMRKIESSAEKEAALGRDVVAEKCPSVDHGIDSVFKTVQLTLGTYSFNTSLPGLFLELGRRIRSNHQNEKIRVALRQAASGIQPIHFGH